uniref:Uncharacterized protein n=1 Tax=Avena sativa TaxID=4498 RepID=A0ACD5Y4I2_AVESA
MAVATPVALVLTVCFLGFNLPSLSVASSSSDFLQCLSTIVPSQLLLTPGSPSFKPLLVSSIRNAKFVAPATARPPLCILTPTKASHVQAAVRCGRHHGVRLRVRSGGHDNEGLSYRSQRPEVFAVVDLAKLNTVRVDPRQATGWVGSGTTLGELYYAIGKAAPGLGFPAGVCPTVGVGGLFTGGGQGLLMRKYGLSADNILDATIVDADGNLLQSKKAMGDDLFWAIRGGGGGSFGIVLSWKVRLVPVPPKVTFFSVNKTIEQGAVDAVTKWQTVAPALPDDLTVRVVVQQRTATFQSLYLGNCSTVVGTLRGRFPELGVKYADCREMSWLQYTAYLYFGEAASKKIPLEVLLLNRTMTIGPFVKNKSDFVKKPLTNNTWHKIFTWPSGAAKGHLILEPHGGRMAKIADGDTPFPHRSGVLYNIQYVQFWNGSGVGGNISMMPNWINGMYDYMAPFVTKNPRAAYSNYRDLDIGVNKVVGGVSTYESGKVWGDRYFVGNFRRLAMIKRKVDPADYFRNEQSVPPLF